MSNTDRITKQVTLKAPRSRVWRAISDSREFGTWFRAALEDPFVPNTTVRGRITYPGYEHLTFEAKIERVEPERYFSYRWQPTAVDAGTDKSKEPSTLVEFQLEDAPGGTLLTIVESGFEQLAPGKRDEAFRRNDGGWSEQVHNIEKHVAQS